MAPLASPAAFPFPFPPYDIQVQFMRTVYSAIEDGKVALMESPTGTGKSLSLICAALQWLQDDAARRMRLEDEPPATDSAAEADTAGLPAWLVEQSAARARERRHQELLERQQRREKLLQRIRALKEDKAPERSLPPPKGRPDTDTDGQFLLEDAGGGADATPRKRQRFFSDDASGDVEECDADNSDDDDAGEKGEGEADLEEVKIFYASRTHSQISQFLGELKRTSFGASVRALALGSRKNLCVNSAVNSPGRSVARINDQCLDLQQRRSEGRKGCPYLEPRSQRQLAYTLLSAVTDIEATLAAGTRRHACPYYGARRASRYAQVVGLPYQMLLHRQARESMGISLKGHIVILDEAHNVVDAVSAMHSVQLSAAQLAAAEAQLARYQAKYQARLSASNTVRIKELARVLAALREWLAPARDASASARRTDAIMRVVDFMRNVRLDNVNYHTLVDFLAESKLAQKLHGFVEFESRSAQAAGAAPAVSLAADEDDAAAPTAPMYVVQAFLRALTNAPSSGRVAVYTSGDGDARRAYFKYLLLDVGEAFEAVVREARCVILAGGTMNPMALLRQQLLPATPAERVVQFTCGHVVPPSSLLVLTLKQGPTGRALNTRFEARDDVRLIDEIGNSVANMARLIPAGLIVFFPSFHFLATVTARWTATNAMERIRQRKMVFTEPRDATAVESMLREYETAVARGGALLLCVVGGKLSEGINFGDNLGRGVMVIGLPYPNRHSPELAEKLVHIEASAGKAAADDFYSNLCMKAVNQSIGRVIRHINDFACIVLADERFAEEGVRARLPGWIRDSLAPPAGFDDTVRRLTRFFATRR